MINYNKILSKISRKIKKLGNIKSFPNITKNGIWQTSEDGFWTGGFWIGLIWLMYKYTRQEEYLKLAYRWLEKLENRKNSKTFDLGFLFYPSFAKGFEITKDSKLKKIALNAADKLIELYNPNINFIHDLREINEITYGTVIIDIMPNLKLLWWAYEKTKIKKYFKIANNHSKQTLRYLIRNDFSTYQALIFDITNFKIKNKLNFQGINNKSCWSRGQAWGILGFIDAYNTTNNVRYLNTAKNLADYFLDHLPVDQIPYWDFKVKNSNETRDTSAATIASLALLKIYEKIGEENYLNSTITILRRLTEEYLSAEDEDGILSEGCFHKPRGKGISESLIWGDFYYVEAIMKLLKINKN